MTILSKIEFAFGADLTADPATWVWTDVSLYALDSVSVTFGRANEASTTQPATCRVRLRNTDARFMPRFPTSPYYPNVRRQTPVRVSLNPGTGYVQRFQGYIDQITPSWPAGNSQVAEVAVTASGYLRRLGQGSAPVLSAMRRSYDTDPVRPVAYWPLEGGKDATVLYDVITGAPTEQVDQSAAIAGQTGAVRFGTASLGEGSDPVPNIAGSWSLGMRLPTGVTATGSVSLQFHMAFGDAVRSGGSAITGFRLNPATATRHLTFQMYVYDAKTAQIDIIEAFADLSVAAGPTTVASFSLGNIFDGQPRAFQLDLTASGGSGVAWNFWMNGTSMASGTYAAGFAGPMNAAPYRVASLTSSVDAAAVQAVGHYAVFTQIVTADRYTALNAHRGETATDRLTRLCAEQGVPITVTGTSDTHMGPQIPATFLTLLRDCEAVDGGVLYDGAAAGLSYLARPSRYNLPVALPLDCLRQQVKLPFLPIEDDQRVRNDWTVSRPAGVPVQYTDATHIAANGLYDSSATINVQSETDLLDQASWRVHLGTVEEMRVPGLSLQLIDHPELWAPWIATTLGERLTAVNLPTQYPPGTLDMILEGYVETWDATSWKVDLNTSPYGPWRIFVVATASGDTSEFCGHVDTDDSALNAGITSAATSFAVKTNSGPLWTTTADDFPFDINVGGEQIRVDSITGGASPQTFNVTRSRNSVVKAHLINASVSLWAPLVLGL